ncbi:MAG: hypothetical protein O3C29_01260 [Proteobacteria bacterium]|nr:hypothetical protein [Pseudomonadota bacterium]MDA1289257.1 hypothetical protein [Pseudomonadota bacterium]
MSPAIAMHDVPKTAWIKLGRITDNDQESNNYDATLLYSYRLSTYGGRTASN